MQIIHEIIKPVCAQHSTQIMQSLHFLFLFVGDHGDWYSDGSLHLPLSSVQLQIVKIHVLDDKIQIGEKHQSCHNQSDHHADGKIHGESEVHAVVAESKCCSYGYHWKQSMWMQSGISELQLEFTTKN